jgi:sodium-coupled monocarboxylate transporter 8/12
MALLNFSIADYVVFASMLLISALIGFYYAFKDRKKNNTDEFLLGGRKLQVIFPKKIKKIKLKL